MTRRGDGGQAATELALVLPLVVLLLLILVQVTLVARDQLLVVAAAREGAREAAVNSRPSATRAAILRIGGLKPRRVTTETSHQGGSPGMVRVSVEYRSPTDVPLVGPLFPDVVLRAKAAMRVELGHVQGKSSKEQRNQQEPRHQPPKPASVGMAGMTRLD